MKSQTYEQKRDAATSQTQRVEEFQRIQGHPKAWDRYIAKRQKTVKEISRAVK